MTKKFRDYLRAVEYQFITQPDLLGSRDRQGDARLYLFTRIDSVLTHLKAGSTPAQCVSLMGGTYARAIENGDYWWR